MIYIFILSILLSSVPVVLYLRALGGCDKLHCVFDEIWLSQERWDLHFSSAYLPSQYVPCFLMQDAFQQIVLHCFLAIAAVAVWGVGMFKAVKILFEPTVSCAEAS